MTSLNLQLEELGLGIAYAGVVFNPSGHLLLLFVCMRFIFCQKLFNSSVHFFFAVFLKLLQHPDFRLVAILIGLDTPGVGSAKAYA